MAVLDTHNLSHAKKRQISQFSHCVFHSPFLHTLSVSYPWVGSSIPLQRPPFLFPLLPAKQRLASILTPHTSYPDQYHYIFHLTVICARPSTAFARAAHANAPHNLKFTTAPHTPTYDTLKLLLDISQLNPVSVNQSAQECCVVHWINLYSLERGLVVRYRS